MDEQPASNNPRTDTPGNPLPPSPVEPAIEQADMARKSEKITTTQTDPTKELKREFRVFEVASLAVNVVLAAIGIGAICIYNGQLSVMKGTLAEMKVSGQTASFQTSDIIHEAQIMSDELIVSNIQSAREFEQTLAANRRISEAQLRHSEALIKREEAVSAAQVERMSNLMNEITHIEQRPRIEMHHFAPKRAQLPTPDHSTVLNVVYFNGGKSTADRVTVAGMECVAGSRADTLFNGGEIPMPNRDDTQVGISVGAFLFQNAEVTCTPKPGEFAPRRALEQLIEVVIYGRFYYTDFSNDWHYTDFCIGGTVPLIVSNTYTRCSHNNTAK